MEIKVTNVGRYEEVEIIDGDYVLWSSGLLDGGQATAMAKKLMDAAEELLK